MQDKTSKKREELSKHLAQVAPGFAASVLLDKNDDPVFIRLWAKDIVVTKLFETK
jgi:hypothetical protein